MFVFVIIFVIWAVSVAIDRQTQHEEQEHFYVRDHYEPEDFH